MKEKNQVLVLFYHKVNILENDYNLLCVSPIKFRQQMLHLKYNYQISRFEDDWTKLDGRSIVITFDDGYLDNLENAVPILEELEIPATIFITTSTMKQDRELWWDELEYLLLEGDNIPLFFQLDDKEFGCRWRTDTWEYRKNCYFAIHYLMKNFINVTKREEWFAQLWKWRKKERCVRQQNLTLSFNDCKKLAESKMISIGAHTVSHPSLANLKKEEQEFEIKASIDTLESIIKKKITLFSYPFGKLIEDFNKDTIEICKKYGILKAVSTESAIWDCLVDPYQIPRMIVRDWGIEKFEKVLKEYWNR